MPQRSIIAPVSTILLQENSLKPAQSAGFFFIALMRTDPIRKRSRPKMRFLDERHGQVTFSPYTRFICIHATDMRDRRRCAASGTPHRILRLLARSWVVPVIAWRAFFCSVFLLSRLPRTAQLLAVVLEPSSDSAMMNFTPRDVLHVAWGQDNPTWSRSNDFTCT
jgi:hypothetical protein